MTAPALDPFFTNATFTPAGVARHPLSRDVRAGAYPVTPPVLHNLTTAEDQLQELEDEATRPTETYAELLARTADNLRDGQPIPEDVLEQARATIKLQDDRRLLGLVVGNLRDSVQDRWSKALREHADDMLAGLRPELEEILDAVRQAAETVGSLDVSDVEAVAAASDEQRAALGTLAELRKRYKRMRGLQRQLVESTYRKPRKAGANVSDELTWRAIFKTDVGGFSKIPELDVPAPELDDTSQWYRRVLDRDDVWIPTIPELLSAYVGLSAPVAKSEPPTPWHERHNSARLPVIPNP